MRKDIDGTVLWAERLLSHDRPDLRQDLLQVGRLAALNALSTYRPDKGCSWRTWCVRYIRRDMLRLLEAESNQHTDIEELLDRDGIDELSDLTAFIRMEDLVDVERMLYKLSDSEREIFIEHLYEDKSLAEISKEKNLSRQYVTKIYNDCVAFLQQQFSLQK